MTAKQLAFVTLGGLLLGSFFHSGAIQDYRSKIDSVTNIACDVVTIRAQGGATRDVHDQIFSFLRKNLPDSSSQVIVRRGGRETGASSSMKNRGLERVCKITNVGDYEIVARFEDRPFLSFELAKRISAFFLLLLLARLIAVRFWRALKEIWFGQVLLEMSAGLGLKLEPRGRPSLASKTIARIFLPSVESVRPAVENLKSSLEKKQSELVQTKRVLEQLEKEKLRAERFASIVQQTRHDLKGPLATLKFAALGSGTASNSSDLLHLTLGSIESIIRELNQSDGLSDSTASLGTEIVEVAIQEVIEEKSVLLEKVHGIRIQFDYDTERLTPIRCEPRHFRRVMANLLQNAIEASPRDGTISILVDNVTNSRVRVMVADQGPGIAPEIATRLFSAGATFGKAAGEGLGLSFVKSSVELWGGSVSEESTPGAGAKFVVDLPIENLGASFRAAPSVESLARLAILDDEIEIHRAVWSKSSGQQKFFRTPLELMDWVESSGDKSSFAYLIDLHLRDVITGVDVVRTLGSKRNAFLMTSDYLNSDAIELARTFGTAIIPKSLLFSRVC